MCKDVARNGNAKKNANKVQGWQCQIVCKQVRDDSIQTKLNTQSLVVTYTFIYGCLGQDKSPTSCVADQLINMQETSHIGSQVAF